MKGDMLMKSLARHISVLSVYMATASAWGMGLGLRMAMWDDGVETVSDQIEVELPEQESRVPIAWLERYPSIHEKADCDCSEALRLPSGKRDAAGRPMYVWQDYVMGTDPTDTNDVFKATITIDGDDVNVSWSPELPAAEAAKRVYTVYGKAELSDAEWIPIPDGADKSAYRFFKVGVEMR